MKQVLLAAWLCGCTLLAFAQGGNVLAPSGGGPRPNQPGDELTPSQRLQIVTMLQQNATSLRQRNLLAGPGTYRTNHVSFSWPVRQAAGFADNGYYGISNYVDHNPVPGAVQDYRCGTRSYDLASGDNHRGTDIFTWPYGWQKMSQNAVEVIAAAGGVIIGKTDGNADRNCTLVGTLNWNAVYLQHPDGTVTWYGHMKAGSLTTKAIGQSVATGEYLGVVGSSGASTSPHLHFEVYTDNTCATLVDPWAGACNTTTGGTSWWASQEAYRVPTVCKVLTHSIAPSLGQCQAGEQANPNRNFSPGGTIYLSSYFRDNINGNSAIHRIFRPDGSVWSSWAQSFADEYDASWWYYTVTLPTSGTYYGVWRYEVTYNGQTASTAFGIGMTLPVEMTGFTATNNQGMIDLNWTTANEEGISRFVVERGTDGVRFAPVGSVPAKNTTGTIAYTFTDAAPRPGKNFYRLRIHDTNTADRFSKTVSVEVTTGALVQAGPVPFSTNLTIHLPVNGSEKVTYQLLNTAGKVMATGGKVTVAVENTANYPPGVYLLVVFEGEQVISRQKLLKL